MKPVDAKIAAWWDALAPVDREDLLVAGSDRRPRAWVLGRFASTDHELDPPEFPLDLYEYLVNHEMFLVDDARTYHICTRHAAAAVAVRAGHIPADFACPLRAADCPMRRVLALGGGMTLVLRVAARRSLADPRVSSPPVRGASR